MYIWKIHMTDITHIFLSQMQKFIKENCENVTGAE